VLAEAGGPFDFRLYVGGADEAALLSTPGLVEDLRFNEQSYLRGGDLRLEITRGGRIDGLLAWIELAVAPGAGCLDSLAEDTNWLPVYIPFAGSEPIGVQPGDVLSLHAEVTEGADGIHPYYFCPGPRAEAGAGVTVRAESRYSGGPFRSTVIHRRLLHR
jgi:hypothetical protein